MTKNCIYCNLLIEEDTPIDVCNKCGHQVWGEKMFGAIKSNMENAQKAGDLNQGSVTESANLPPIPEDEMQKESEFEFKNT